MSPQYQPIENGCKDCSEANKIIVAGWFLLKTSWERTFAAEITVMLISLLAMVSSIAQGNPVTAVILAIACFGMLFNIRSSYEGFKRSRHLTKGFEKFHQEIVAEQDSKE